MHDCTSGIVVCALVVLATSIVVGVLIYEFAR